MKHIFKSTIAILAGFISIVFLSTFTDFILEKTGVFPSFQEQMTQSSFTAWMLLLALAYRSIYGILGSYIAAKLSPRKPMLHAMILGVIGFALSLLGAIVMWEQGAAWYTLGLVLLTFPCAWLGGKLAKG
jgi:hypothetical protein